MSVISSSVESLVGLWESGMRGRFVWVGGGCGWTRVISTGMGRV